MKAAGRKLDDLKRANREVGTFINGNAAPTAPRRTGALAASTRPNAAATNVAIRSRLPYAGPIHWGWPARNIEPQPWLWATATGTQDEWLPKYEDEIQRIMDDIEGA